MSVELQEKARRLIERRRGITRYFDAHLFADPARDILLALFVAGDQGRPRDPDGCAAIAHVPESTARRWIDTLAGEGLVIADDMLRLSERGRAAMAGYLASIG